MIIHFYPGYTLESIGSITLKQCLILIKEIAVIKEMESGTSDEDDNEQIEEQSMTGDLGAALAKQILPNGPMPDFVNKRARGDK